MKFTVSLNKNRDFRRLYARGKSTAGSCLVVYCRKNNQKVNRLGLTVGTKIGNAVIRNLVRRRIKEAYREIEESLTPGFDIVIVARNRAPFVPYADIKASLLTLFSKVIK